MVLLSGDTANLKHAVTLNDAFTLDERYETETLGEPATLIALNKE